MKCKNCGHGIIKTAANDYFHLLQLTAAEITNHQTCDFYKVEYELTNRYICMNGWRTSSFCGCNQPFPEELKIPFKEEVK